jgi:hypothetical protein
VKQLANHSLLLKKELVLSGQTFPVGSWFAYKNLGQYFAYLPGDNRFHSLVEIPLDLAADDELFEEES